VQFFAIRVEVSPPAEKFLFPFEWVVRLLRLEMMNPFSTPFAASLHPFFVLYETWTYERLDNPAVIGDFVLALLHARPMLAISRSGPLRDRPGSKAP